MSEGSRDSTRRSNRDRLLEAALAVFLEQGYETATIRGITGRAGLAPGTFYNYFVDKEAIFRAILDGRIARVAQAVREFRSRALDGEEFIRFAYEAYFRTIADDPDSFILALRNEQVIGSLYRVPVAEAARTVLLEDLDHAMAQGWLPEVDREYLAAAFIGVGQEIARLMVQRRPLDPGHAARFATGLFLGGLDGLPRDAREPRG